MRKLLLLLMLLASSAGAHAQPTRNEVAFQKCDGEGFTALNIARNYLLGGKRREAVTPYIGEDTAGKAMLEELVRLVEANEIRHYVDFAAVKLYQCSRILGIPIGEPIDKARVCYARVDIPFFLHVDRQKGVPKEDAIRKVRKLLPDTKVFPQELIAAVADQVYETRNPAEVKKLMGTTFWSCLYRDQIKKGS
jgi:hypothetical protein